MGNIKQTQSYRHPTFGIVKVIQNSIIYKMSIEEQEYQLWQIYKNSKPSSQLLFLDQKHKIIQEGFCTDKKQAQFIFPDYPYSLQLEIQRRKQKKQPQYFEQQELWLILYTLICANNLMSKHNTKIGDVKPKNIMLNQKGHIKIICHYSLPNQFTNFEKATHDREDYGFLAPQQLQFIKQQNYFLRYDKSKAQIFSIGITVLQSASLDFFNCFYINDKINKLFISQKLIEAQLHYSNQLVRVLKKMLQFSVKKRPNSDQLLQLLNQHKESIQNLNPFTLKIEDIQKLGKKNRINQTVKREKILLKEKYNKYLSPQPKVTSNKQNQLNKKIDSNRKIKPVKFQVINKLKSNGKNILNNQKQKKQIHSKYIQQQILQKNQKNKKYNQIHPITNYIQMMASSNDKTNVLDSQKKIIRNNIKKSNQNSFEIITEKKQKIHYGNQNQQNNKQKILNESQNYRKQQEILSGLQFDKLKISFPNQKENLYRHITNQHNPFINKRQQIQISSSKQTKIIQNKHAPKLIHLIRQTLPNQNLHQKQFVALQNRRTSQSPQLFIHGRLTQRKPIKNDRLQTNLHGLLTSQQPYYIVNGRKTFQQHKQIMMPIKKQEEKKVQQIQGHFFKQVKQKNKQKNSNNVEHIQILLKKNTNLQLKQNTKSRQQRYYSPNCRIMNNSPYYDLNQQIIPISKQQKEFKKGKIVNNGKLINQNSNIKLHKQKLFSQHQQNLINSNYSFNFKQNNIEKKIQRIQRQHGIEQCYSPQQEEMLKQLQQLLISAIKNSIQSIENFDKKFRQRTK